MQQQLLNQEKRYFMQIDVLFSYEKDVVWQIYY